MKKVFIAAIVAIVLIGNLFLFAIYSSGRDQQQRIAALSIDTLTGNVSDGEYVARMSGCIGCHTDLDNNGELLAGGVAFKSKFGTIYSPNISSDPAVGIGHWQLNEFANAMLIGVSPDGSDYYPAFPYSSYSVMTDQDIVDLKAWLASVPASAVPSKANELRWPFSNRLAMRAWKALFFDPARSVDVDDRGQYLVQGPGHCAECHANRNVLAGAFSRKLSGTVHGPEGSWVPGITAQHLNDWTTQDVELFLEVGVTVTGDFTGGKMADVIEHSTALLTPDDRKQIADYLLTAQ